MHTENEIDKPAENLKTVRELRFSMLDMGIVYVAPEVRQVVLDDEIREAVIDNWAKLKWNDQRRTLITDHSYPIPFRVRTWHPELFTEVFAIGI